MVAHSRVISILLLFAATQYAVCTQTLRTSATTKTCSTPAIGSQTNLVNSGGPVVLHSKIYAIFWGALSAWPSDFQAGAIDYLSHINGTKQLKLMQQYMGPTAAPITSSFGGFVNDVTNAVPTKVLTSKDYGAEACRMYPNPDPNGLYVVFSNVAPKMTFCAQHGSHTCGGVSMSVSWVPNLAIQPLYATCSVFSNPFQKDLKCNKYSNGTQAIVLSLAHEVYESITDPLGNAWRDSSGREIGDKCSSACYSQCVTNSNGVGWELQPFWSNSLKGCAYGS